MKIEGIHHVTCITGDAPGNVEFYVRVLGLRMVKKTVNQDDPTVYHLFYADELGSAGAGTVHHVAWASTMEDHEAWRDRVRQVGMHPTQVIDRFWFLSIYFREPSGVLFEIATLGPGFTADEPLETLGGALTLPPNYERFRDQLEQSLTNAVPSRPAVASKTLPTARGSARSWAAASASRPASRAVRPL